MEGEKRGLGRVVYSVDNKDRSEDEEREVDPAIVTEASEESFPASDPPSYTKGSSEHTTEPDESG